MFATIRALLLWVLAVSQLCSSLRQQRRHQDEWFFSRLNANTITCPVLAMMVNAGALHPDKNGSITLEDMHDGMLETGADEYTATFFAIGVIQYDKKNKDTQLHRDRCFPGTECYLAKQRANWKVTSETERYLNIYNMNGVETVEHGFSTGIRGGWTNPPDFDSFASCKGKFPCEEQFKVFAEPCATPSGRFYRENILCINCRAQQMGDRGSEWSFHPLSKRRAWQMNVAMLSMLAGYGRLPHRGADPHGPETYFTMEDMRQMFMQGKNPRNHQLRKWSNFTMIKDMTETTMPCGDRYGDTAPWWGDSKCPSNTGVPCAPIFGIVYKESCPAGSTCIGNSCVCGRGKSGVSMCSNGKGQCVEREDKCTYFGKPCTKIVADNPSVLW